MRTFNAPAYDKRTMRRQHKCYKAFDFALNEQLKEKLMHCVVTSQETPVLGRVRGEQALPEKAIFLGKEESYVFNWYIQFCDQSVPDIKQEGE